MPGSIARILRPALLIWSAVTFLPAWLVTIRGLFDGEDYAWGVSDRIKGRGISGPYLLAPVTALYGIALLALGWHGVKRPFHLMLAAWHGPIAIATSIAAQRNREALRLQGDTLGIDISLADVAPVMLAGVAGGTAALAGLERNPEVTPRQASGSPRLLGLALALLPAQLVLLRAGEQNGQTDKLGVLLTIAQWTLINVALARKE